MDNVLLDVHTPRRHMKPSIPDSGKGQKNSRQVDPSRSTGIRWSDRRAKSDLGPMMSRSKSDMCRINRSVTDVSEGKQSEVRSNSRGLSTSQNKYVQSLWERSDVGARLTKQMYDDLLDKEDGILQQVAAYVWDNEVCNLRKREILHKKWSDRVHEPIRKRIIEEMDGPGFFQHNKKKRDLYMEYIEYLNRTGHVFLDTIPPDDYFPLGLISSKPTYARLRMKRMDDPLLSNQRARSSEEKAILRCQTGYNSYSDRDLAEIRLPLLPPDRHPTSYRKWQLAPHQYVESPLRQCSRKKYSPEKWTRIKQHMTASHFGFEEWGLPVDREVVDMELGIRPGRAAGRQAWQPPIQQSKTAVQLAAAQAAASAHVTDLPQWVASPTELADLGECATTSVPVY